MVRAGEGTITKLSPYRPVAALLLLFVITSFKGQDLNHSI